MSRRIRRREKLALVKDKSFRFKGRKDKGIVVCHVWTAKLSLPVFAGRRAGENWFNPFKKVQNPFSARRSLFLLLILLGTFSVEIFRPSLPSDVGV